jgi:hypothetical protein
MSVVYHQMSNSLQLYQCENKLYFDEMLWYVLSAYKRSSKYQFCSHWWEPNGARTCDGFWLPLCLAIVLSSLLRYTDSDYLPSIYGFWLPPFDIRILITSLRYTDSDYLSSIYRFWLPPFDIQILITPLVSSYSSYFYCMETFLIIQAKG